MVTLFAVTVSECRTTSDFKCANNLCLPKSVKCDGRDQCGDGFDENELCSAFWCFFCFLYTSFIFFRKKRKSVKTLIERFSPAFDIILCVN